MTAPEFEARILPQIEKFLQTMPCFRQGEDNCENAWENLMEIYPDHEPGMGMWDRIQDLIRDWIAACLEKQALEDLREYWDERTEHDDDYDENRKEVEEHGVAPYYPPLDEMRADIARELLGDVLNRAESEADRRRDEKDEFNAMWEDPRDALESFADYLRSRLSDVHLEPADIARIGQWIQLCSAIPFLWPPMAPTLRLLERSSGNRSLRFTFDGSRLEISAPKAQVDLFDKVAGWQTLVVLSHDELSGDVFQTLEVLESGADDLPHGFNLFFEDPVSDIPARFWVKPR